MFIVGVVGVVGVVVGVTAYDDHSNHGNHSNHSQYSDAELIAQITSKKKQREYKLDELERMEKNLLSKYIEEISVLEEEPVLADKISIIKGNDRVDNINNIDRIRNDLLVHIKNKLEKELADDREQLTEIDKALIRINEIQLSNKR